ncbi:elements of external origin [Burkholderia multivorans]|uniref:elements of external origin n=1 Tax=Burkholderia multivorans TaxID=87883 RepID=UPI000D001267|nr:elements of external origin [Burkholderia multivorans]PRG81300.1 elements of external origin [Burkholderia multivorans]
MGLSIRAYARHRGVSHVAVKKAIDTGRITPLPDGTIDAETADAQWARNTVQPRRAPEQKPHTPQRAQTRPERQLPDPVTPPLPTGGTSLLQARTVNEVLKAQLHKVELAQRKGELVDRAQAVAHVFKLARSERDAWLNWPARISAQMAARLDVDAHALHVALEAAVREHLQELGELRPRVD